MYYSNLFTCPPCQKNKVDFAYEISVIKLKYIKVGYPPILVTSLINTCIVDKEDPIIPLKMFDERKTVHFQFLFCKTNEQKIKPIVDRFEKFANNKVKFIYYWKTRKLKSLFALKHGVKHKANIVYKRTFS